MIIQKCYIIKTRDLLGVGPINGRSCTMYPTCSDESIITILSPTIHNERWWSMHGFHLFNVLHVYKEDKVDRF